ncbi:MAG: ribonuclease HII [Candidatus Altiarchaeales archaeon]|nr:ribonuclease HII [Candidatus Altiarchaeales archaeon]MBD3415527.1 ribonuclease HII [Candidatus Altiarchaeales archaeon]
MESLVCGVDEAGRGPVVGPLVLGCAVFDAEGKAMLRDLKVRDSKKLSQSRRVHLEPLIKEVAVEWKVVRVSPVDIDRLRRNMSLNVIEAYKTAEMILSLENTPSKIIIDSADAVAENYARKFASSVQSLNPEYILPEVLSEHKADDNHLEVSAASVLAKVDRDRCIEELKLTYGDFGSGYPSDELTQAFIRDVICSGEVPECVRRSWNTLDRSRQTSICDY